MGVMRDGGAVKEMSGIEGLVGEERATFAAWYSMVVVC